MNTMRRVLVPAATLVALAVVVAGCRAADEPTADDPAAEDVPGVTSEPCEDAVNEDNGCIYLGALTPLTGAFAPVTVPIAEADAAFWQHINEQGGVGGYDIDAVTYLRDTQYNPEITNTMYQEVRDHVLALSASAGSAQTLAILDDLVSDDVIATPIGWASPFEFEPNLIPAGANYCMQAMNGVDWAVENLGVKEKILSIDLGSDFGFDSNAGVKAAAESNGIEFVSAQTVVGADNQAGVVAEILRQNPELVYISTTPTELATIVGAAVGEGFEGQFMSAYPTWNAALLDTPVGPILAERYHQVAPWDGWAGDTPGHEEMRQALDGVTPNDGYASGWAWGYGLLGMLELAASEGPITRASLLKAANEITEIDYHGMLPAEAGSRVGEPNDWTFRASVIKGFDDSAATKMSSVAGFYEGPTAADYQLTEPCY